MKYYQPLEVGKYYHIYNKGINGENIFKEERNYDFFLKKYIWYIDPVVNTYAYCLLKNHFHLLIQPDLPKICHFLNQNNKTGQDVTKLISRQFASFFSSYAQAINKTYARTGGLFEEPFERKEVNSEIYFNQMLMYIHKNPQKHGLVDDFRVYPHSSYHSFLATQKTRLSRETVLEWFGSSEAFQDEHAKDLNMETLKGLTMEF